VQAAEPGLDIALEDLVVPRLVHDLGRLEELLVGARHDVHELTAGEHRPLLAVHEDGQAPRGDAPVELDAVALAELLPQRAAVDVDELVGEHAAIVGLGRGPRDVAGGVPLIALGLFVEAPHVLGLHGVVELEHGVDRSADHASVHEVLLELETRKIGF
jgi:hypothetical protein